MKIDKNNKTIHFGTFELIAAVNYVERCVTKGERTTWKLVPEVTITRRPAKATEKAVERR